MKKFLSLILVLSFALSLTACGGKKEAAPAQSGTPAVSTSESEITGALDEYTRLTLCSASIGGALYNWGANMGTILTENVNNLELTNEASNGPAANLGLVCSGQTDIGVVTDSVAYEAYTGTGDYDGQADKYSNMRAMYVAYPSGLQIFTIKGTGITKLEDLNGARIGFGPSGSSGDLIGHKILEVLGIKAGEETYLGWTDTISNLKDGLIDVCVDVGGYPHSSRQELEATNEVIYIELTDEQLQQVNDVYSYYKLGVIPQETYKYLTEDYDTLLMWYDVICSSDLDANTVYTITKASYENVDNLATVSSLAQFLYPENLEYCSIPLHVGAIQYFEEAGVEIPEELYPPEYSK